MANAAAKPCRHLGCGALVRDGSGYCQQHQAHRWRNKSHGSSGVRKTGRQGVADRERIRMRDAGLCQSCLRKGVIKLGDEVDHIKPLAHGGDDSDSNKELLCKACHKEKSKNEAAMG